MGSILKRVLNFGFFMEYFGEPADDGAMSFIMSSQIQKLHNIFSDTERTIVVRILFMHLSIYII